jgi:hypothetical protein
MLIHRTPVHAAKLRDRVVAGAAEHARIMLGARHADLCARGAIPATLPANAEKEPSQRLGERANSAPFTVSGRSSGRTPDPSRW